MDAAVSTFQAFPPPALPPPPPGVFYPTSITTAQSSPSHSNGSFVVVFIVLAVIIVVSAVACLVGRICSKRYLHRTSHPVAKKDNNHSHNTKHHKNQRQLPSGERVRDRDLEFAFRSKEGDIELGFEKRVQKGRAPSAMKGGEGRGYRKGGEGGDGRGHESGHMGDG